jgi:hypothetical protein
LLGQTQHGVYDEANNFDPALLHRYYGASKSCTSNHSDSDSGSNLSDSDSESDSSDPDSLNPRSSPSPNDHPISDDGPIPEPDDNPSTSSDRDSTSDSDRDSTPDPDRDPTSDSNNPTSSSDSNPNSSSGVGSSDGTGPTRGGSLNGDESSEEEARSEGQHRKIARTIASSQKRNIRHDAAKVARSTIPFEGVDEAEAYTLALRSALASDEYPAGFSLHEEYESVESYKTGRSSKPLVIPLPYDVWFPRIVVWCKALDLLKRLPMCRAAAASPVP